MTYEEAIVTFGPEVVAPTSAEVSPFPNWFTFGLATAAFLLSVYNTWWQRREAKRNRMADLTIRPHYTAGMENRSDRRSNTPPERIYIDLLSTAPTTIERVGLSPPRSFRRWGSRDLSDHAYTLETPARSSHKLAAMMRFRAPLPKVCDPGLELIFEVPNPFPKGLNRSKGVRVWVETSTGQRIVSRPLQLPAPLPWPADEDDVDATA